MKTCTVEGCENPHYSKGLCRAHYMRQRKNTPKNTDEEKQVEMEENISKLMPEVEATGAKIEPELPLQKELDPRFQKMYNLLDTTRLIPIQHYTTGELKLVRESTIRMHIESFYYTKNYGSRSEQIVDRPPVWRRVEKSELPDLWKVWVNHEYYIHTGSNARSLYQTSREKLNELRNGFGHIPENINMLQDPSEREAFIEIDRLRNTMTKCEAVVAESDKYKSIIKEYLLDTAKKYIKLREAEQYAKKEQATFQSEEIKLRAQQKLKKEFEANFK